MLKAGSLDRRVAILEKPDSSGAQNNFGEVPEYGPQVATVWAMVEDEGEKAKITIRYRSDVGPDWRILWENRLFIVLTKKEVGRREGLVMDCKEKIRQ